MDSGRHYYDLVKRGIRKMLGRVKWFNNQKGYGFIVDAENKDYFVHYSNIQGEGYKTLEQDAEVSFDAVQSERGVVAANVKVMA